MKRSKLLDAANQTADTDYSASPPLSGSQAGHIPTHAILVASLLTSLFLVIFVVTCYIFLVKYRSKRSDFGMSPPSQSDDTDDEFVDGHQGLCLVPTLGLHPSIINSITVFEFRKDDHIIHGPECSVCLSEFREDDALRLLPKCCHAFHIPCIDAWLSSHTNCPSCRAGIISDTVSPPWASNRSGSSNLSPNEATQIENVDIVGGLGSNLSHRSAVCENRVESQEVDGESNGVDYSKEVVSSNGDGASPVFVDMTEKTMNMEDRIKAVRRSVSVESSSTENTAFSVPKVNPVNQ